MAPVIPKDKWRKGSQVLVVSWLSFSYLFFILTKRLNLSPSGVSFQWIMLIRKHAELVVDDKHVFKVFRKHCKVVILVMLILIFFSLIWPFRILDLL
jgi:hypothetical protein